jgi:hypothetical protein
LFVGHLHDNTEFAIWDLFFIKGSTVIFRVALTMLELMQDEIMNCDNYGDFYMVMNDFPKTIDRETLLKNLVSGIQNK